MKVGNPRQYKFYLLTRAHSMAGLLRADLCPQLVKYMSKKLKIASNTLVEHLVFVPFVIISVLLF
jgi:hypothetical protein